MASLLAHGTMAHDPKEFIDLYDRHSDAVYRFILFKVSDREAAWDLTQDCFTKTWEYWRSEKGSVSNQKAFLFTVARNLVIDHWRARARTQTVSLDVDTIDIAEKGNGTHDRLVLKDETQSVMKLIGNLPESDREMLTLRYTEELSFKEIAKVTGKSIIAARVHAHRALGKLKRMITP
ncbi:RNA polymerase sigma factor [Candidatus Azambacteria bacterium]|nr:RNA polymerase sigma factor [Candidatus Azambacteria bacterium]